MNVNEIRELAEILAQNGLESIEIKEGDRTLKLKAPIAADTSLSLQKISPSAAPAPAVPEAAKPGSEVTSPIVGVFYSAPAPGAAPYVKVGSKVSQGDTLCIVEAMKLMNEITAEFDGEVIEILALDGQVVEYGQPLFRIS